MATATRSPTRHRPPARRPPRRGGSAAAGVVKALLGFVLVVGVVTGGAWVAIQQVAPHSDVVVVERCTATNSGADHDLAPDQAADAALISAVAQRRGLPARAATIAIATAMQESKLRNITYGDRDSLGLFQQRPSQGWGTAAQVQDPVYATNAFLSAVVKVDGYAALPVGDVAQRVQRSAYPQAYNAHESMARAYASALEGYSPGALTCRLRAPDDDAAQVASSNGYWPRTQTVLDSLGVEQGPVAAAAADAGAAVRLGAATSAGSDGVRRGWALAAWSVAHASDLDIVAVGTDGRMWRRDAPDAGWPTVMPDVAKVWAPPGAVVVVVAGGQLPPTS